eukprot:455120_1
MSVSVVREWYDWFLNQNKMVKACTSLFTLIIARYFATKIYRKVMKYPPGYIGLPYLGVVPWLFSNGQKFYCECADTGHKILLLPYPAFNMYLINDPEIMKVAFSGDDSTCMPNNLFNNGDGTAFSFLNGGSEWLKRKKIFQTGMNRMINKKILSQRIETILQRFMFPILDKHCPQTNNNNKLLWCPMKAENVPCVTFNVMYNCIFGDHLKSDDAGYLELHKTEKQWAMASAFNIFVWLFYGTKTLDFVRKYVMDPYKTQNDNLNSVVRKFVSKAVANYDKNDDIQNTFFYFIYQDLLRKETITDDKIVSDFMIALLGGVDNIANLLNYLIALACKYPDLQQEIYEETVGDNDCDDKLKSFVHEAIRMMPAFPANYRQVNKRDGMKINGITIPYGAVFSGNILGMQRCEKYWKNAKSFDINRWLDNETGKFTKKYNPKIFTFGFGKKMCAGEVLTMRIVYLIIHKVFKKYKFYVDYPQQFDIKFILEAVLHVDHSFACKIQKR